MSRKHRQSRTSIAPAPRAISAQISEQKLNPAYSALTFTDLPTPVSMGRNYRAFVKEAYQSDDVVYKCVVYLTQNGGAIPPRLYTDRTMEREIEDHPLLDKLDRPNPEQTGVEYREAVLGYYLIAGNCYQYAIRAGIKGPPDELWTLEPDKVHPMAARTRGIESYKYDDFTDGKTIPTANIGRLRAWNPADPIMGMSALEPIALLVDMRTAARKWNLALTQNSGKLPGVWTVPTALGKQERDQLEQKLNDKYAGPRNAGKSVLVDAGAKWERVAVPPAEMDWLEAIKYNAAAIANAYNISPQLIGDTASTTYENMQQAKVASYTEAIFPALDKLYALWNMWLVPMYPDLCDGKGQPRAYLYYDKTTVEVIQHLIQEQKTAQADRAIKAYLAGAITLNQAQVMQDLPEIGPAGDVYRLGAVLVPADKLADYAAQSLTTPAAPPMPEPEPIQLPPPALGTDPGNTPAKPDDELPKSPPDSPAPNAPPEPPKQQEGKARPAGVPVQPDDAQVEADSEDELDDDDASDAYVTSLPLRRMRRKERRRAYQTYMEAALQ